MKVHVPQILPFNESVIGKETIYIFPLPHGFRCVAKTDGKEITVCRATGEDITGFAPDVEEAFMALCREIMSEPNPRFTVNGKQEVFPDLVFDFILHDRAERYADDGRDDVVKAALLDDWECIGAPIESGKAKATILSHMFYDEYVAGRCPRDIWMQRAQHKRCIIAAGLGVPSHEPLPILTWLTIAPRTVGYVESGIAAHEPGEAWGMIYNTFTENYRGALIVDVWQGWNVRGGAFRLLKEEDVEI